jgi:hypothetical protein
MRNPQKNLARLCKSASVDEQKRNPHASGLTMSRLLFARVDRVVEQLGLSRGEFMITAATEILNMCEDRKQRWLPELVVRYDELRHPQKEELKTDDPQGAQRCGTHFRIGTENRIAAVVQRIGWSRNQFITDAMRRIVDMCEDPRTRRLPGVVILHDAERDAVPFKLRRRPLSR